MRSTSWTQGRSVNSLKLCDWCQYTGHGDKPAQFITVTGDLQYMEISEYYICATHAERLVKGAIKWAHGKDHKVTRVDEFELTWLDDATQYLLEKARAR